MRVAEVDAPPTVSFVELVMLWLKSAKTGVEAVKSSKANKFLINYFLVNLLSSNLELLLLF